MSTECATVFDAYATVYDAIRQGQLGVSLAEWALQRLPEPNKRRVLDLACGTGSAALMFAEAGCNVTAVDCSPAMLEIARRTAHCVGHNVTFVQADVRDVMTKDEGRTTKDGRRTPDDESKETRRHGDTEIRHLSPTPLLPYSLVTCFGDSLAYLANEGDLDMLFAGVAQVLEPDGAFVFDTRAEEDYASWDECEIVMYDGDDYFVYQQMHYEPETRRAVIRIVWFENQGERWYRGEEAHHLRMWSDEDIRDAVETAGLNVDSVEQVTPVNGERRVVWIARRGAETR
jgi:SAM-dependent methyltransferase